MFPGTMPCSLMLNEYWLLSVVVITMTYPLERPCEAPRWFPWLWPLQGCAYGSGWALSPGKAIIWGGIISEGS